MPLMWRCELRTRLREAVRTPCRRDTASSLNRDLRGIRAFTERDAFRTGFQGGRRSPCMKKCHEAEADCLPGRLAGLEDGETGATRSCAAKGIGCRSQAVFGGMDCGAGRGGCGVCRSACGPGSGVPQAAWRPVAGAAGLLPDPAPSDRIKGCCLRGGCAGDT